MKINDMFKKIESNTAQPQSVGIGIDEQVYSKVTGLISSTDGANDCLPDSANPQPDLAAKQFALTAAKTDNSRIEVMW